MDLGAYYDEIIEGTEDVREVIGRMKFISEKELTRIEEINEEIKKDMKAVLEKGGVESDA